MYESLGIFNIHRVSHHRVSVGTICVYNMIFGNGGLQPNHSSLGPGIPASSALNPL